MRFVQNIPELSWKNYSCLHFFFQNMRNVKRLEIAESLDFYSLSYNGIKTIFQQILGNRTYSANAKRLSRLIKDQKEHPLDRAIWWIEWILRYPHVNTKSPVNTLGYFVGNSLDVISFATIIFILQAVILCRIVIFIVKYITQVLVKRIKHFNKIYEFKKFQ